MNCRGVPVDCQNSEGCKKLCNTFLVHRLAKRDEIWQWGHWCVANLKLFWLTFPGAQIFDTEYFAHFLLERDENW